mgnify:CR=1 FL=1|jgi:hypothetical protein|tara:strand:- start:166 stop:351 length:186 start_codon:yes stop_codon:yes gene_type:complete
MNKEKIQDIIHDIELQMVQMWSLDEATYVLKNDPEYMTMILTAVHYEKDHFRALGMVIGEA